MKAMMDYIDTIEEKLLSIIMWGFATLCFLYALYSAINRTLMIFAPHNYLLAPLGDDALDAVNVLFPISQGQKSLWYILTPFADHRLAVGRLFSLLDFFFTSGTQAAHPYRVAISLWLGYFLFIGSAILPNKGIIKPAKLIIAALYLTFVFSGTALINYGSTIMNTWPILLVFVLLTFIALAKYCDVYANNATQSKLLLYLFTTFLFLMLALYTFGAGLMLWPIIFIVLVKRDCFKKNRWIWISLAIVSYLTYSFHWNGGSAHGGMKHFLHHPINMFLYLSQILSIPVIKNASDAASIQTISMALIIICFTFLAGIIFIKKIEWSTADTIIFSFFCFSATSVFGIAISRFWMPCEAVHVAARFVIPVMILLSCISIAGFSLVNSIKKDRTLVNTGSILLASLWLLIIFIPSDNELCGNNGVYSQALPNQYLIAATTGIPIDVGYNNEIKQIQNQQNVVAHNYLFNIQKKYHKGVYSLWQTNYINHTLEELNFKIVPYSISNVIIQKGIDFRRNDNPGLLVTITLPNYNQPLSTQWEILFTNSQEKIIGYAISSPYFQTLLKQWQQPTLYWAGALNTKLVNEDSKVKTWAVNKKTRQMIELGEITI